MENITEKILNYTANYEIPETITQEQAYEELIKRIKKIEQEGKTTKLNNYYYIIGIAATLLIVVGLYSVFRNNRMQNITATNGTQTSAILPDGSHVTLNAGSKISFKEFKFSDSRELTLAGEAFFDIQKGGKFLINTSNGDIEVLGTSFSVYNREKEFKVACITGKVRVKSGTEVEVIQAGECVEKQNNTLVKFEVKNIDNATKWLQGEFFFENSSLFFIFAELERQYNIEVIVSGIDNRFFTGKFTNKNLRNALDIICIPMNLDYEIIENKTVIIRKKQ